MEEREEREEPQEGEEEELEERDSDWEDEQAEAARREAGEIGGRAGDEDLDPAERPLVEGGEGVAEGFELAEEELVERASHAEPGGDPLDDAYVVEDETETEATYGEADHEHSSEKEPE
jgi:hypothetical protein